MSLWHCTMSVWQPKPSNLNYVLWLLSIFILTFKHRIQKFEFSYQNACSMTADDCMYGEKRFWTGLSNIDKKLQREEIL